MSGRTARVVGVLIVCAVLWWMARGGGDRRAVEWAEVRKDDLVLGVEVTGTLAAVDSSSIGPPQISDVWDFKISRMAPEGSQVKAGDPVLGFDTSELERKLDQKKAEADSARKQLEKRVTDRELRQRQDALRRAEAEARVRKSTLKVDRPGDLSSAIELAQARLDLALARDEMEFLAERDIAVRRSDEAEFAAISGQRDRAEQRVREIQDAIARMTVPSPRDGTVIYVSDWRGEKKKVGDGVWRGQRILEVPDLRTLRANGEVDEADSGKLAKGQPVEIRLDAHPDVGFRGRVASIWTTVQRKSYDNPLKVVKLDIDLEKTDSTRMRPGMRFRGKVETGRIRGALIVPAECVTPTPEGPTVRKKTPWGSRTVPVKLGGRDAAMVEVLDGLSEGDRVERVAANGASRTP